MALSTTLQRQLVTRKLQKLIDLVSRLGGRAALYDTAQGLFVAPTWIESFPVIGAYKIVPGSGTTYDVYKIIGEDFRSNYRATLVGVTLRAAAELLVAHTKRSTSVSRFKAFLKGDSVSVAPFISSVDVDIWSPLSLSNLVAWYSAKYEVYSDAGSTLAVNNDTIQQWNDLSGNGYNVSATPNPPTYKTTDFNGKPSVLFGGSAGSTGLSTVADAVALSTPTISAFLVGTMGSGSSQYARVFNFRATGQSNDYDNVRSFCMDRNASTENFLIEANGQKQPGTDITYDNKYRFGLVVDSAKDVNFYLDGSLDTNYPLSTSWDFGGPSQTGICMIGHRNGGEYWGGYVSEIVFCGTELTSQEIQNLDFYFTKQWGF